MTESEIIRDAGQKIREGKITNIMAFSRAYKLTSPVAANLYTHAKDAAMIYGVDMFPAPNHENTLKEMNR